MKYEEKIEKPRRILYILQKNFPQPSIKHTVGAKMYKTKPEGALLLTINTPKHINYY